MTTPQTAAPPSVPAIPRAAGTGAATVPEILRRRAATHPERTAFVFLTDGEEPGEQLTYAQLHREAAERAEMLCAAGLRGRNAVMLYPAGLEFVKALMGCMYAGVTGAPVQVPSRESGYRRLRGIADDAGASAILTDSETLERLRAKFAGSPHLEGLTLIATDAPSAAVSDEGAEPGPDDLALLQYTSGSTGDPKGVMITHANFIANAEETDALWPCGDGAVFVSWLPHFHDMGMLFGIIAPLWAGAPSYLMAPAAFVRRPGRWPEAMSRFRGTHTAGPSFAYELCVREAAEIGVPGELDLSAWRVAGNGAEPVRWRVVEDFTAAYAPVGFRPETMCPGYGLAENTLKASGSPTDRKPLVLWVDPDKLREGRVVHLSEEDPAALALVGSGVPVEGTRLRIVEPESLLPVPEGGIGEIWISGPCVAAGYLGREKESDETFRARTGDRQGPGAPTYLRTGDLGFEYDGELFVTGRIKDLIIRKGRNFYPQDIETAVESAESRLGVNCSAAFSVDDGTAELLVVVVEAGVRTFAGYGAEALRERIRAAVYESQRLHVDDVVLVRRGSLPKTSSGKVQRRRCRQLYLEGALAPIATDGTDS
ncbi:fatty acyl-AMP ligase [Actinospica sp. MGRD01-02]|uniref:Fatty acyl-AMP ligase n=1 Tax=Actinospica acidithermotolerans TaxID=2828514 RepID=A0A941EH09_9ACTN|nr:fatty acyl-AMP ligase [Actinospica acidithermotolerans]MBR7830603.1 fatty acyl-AMP ligase [Actinospica acidithermotolerans]